MAINMKYRLVLIQHTVETPINYKGFTVKRGMFYGVVKTPYATFPAAWSGWTQDDGSIALYVNHGGGWRIEWDSEDVFLGGWHIGVTEEDWDNIPFFVE